jgi:hypothetical protein
MPVISMFYGIIISLYYVDNKQHHRPHIHAKYEEHEAVVSITDGKTVERTTFCCVWIHDRSNGPTVHPGASMNGWPVGPKMNVVANTFPRALPWAKRTPGLRPENTAHKPI